jgi:ABC-type antimicrobial peptide transport system permease subunit
MKKVYRILRMSVLALRRNVMRSVLTTLGIVIGVGAVIAMMEIGKGSSTAVKQTIASMGANNLLVLPGTASSGGVSFGSGTVVTLTPGDAEALSKPDRCPAIAAAAPIVRARTQVVYGNKNWVPLYIYGTTPEFLKIRDWQSFSEGNPFTAQDVTAQREVCVLGQTIVRELFADESPFTVVGVLSLKGANMMGLDQDDIVLAPWTTIKFKVAGQSTSTTNQSSSTASTITPAAGQPAGGVNTLSTTYPGTDTRYPAPSPTQMADQPQLVRFTNVDQILVQATSAGEIPLAIAQINELLRERHHIRPGQPEDFNVRDMTEMSKALGKTSDRMSGLIVLIALVSLIVGGVGIMNIMMVSVTERTREIGLRMAVGATAGSVLAQFLLEAVILSMLGGLAGITLGLGAAIGLAHVAGWPLVVSPAAVLLAVAVAGAVGVFFGFYPAWKASRLDPIEALRYE